MNLSELATTIETLKKDNEELKFFVQVLLIGQAAYPWASRDEAMRMLQVTSPTLKSMAEKGIIEYRKGQRKIEFKRSDIIAYLLEKKRIYPGAIQERMENSFRKTTAKTALQQPT